MHPIVIQLSDSVCRQTMISLLVLHLRHSCTLLAGAAAGNTPESSLNRNLFPSGSLSPVLVQQVTCSGTDIVTGAWPCWYCCTHCWTSKGAAILTGRGGGHPVRILAVCPYPAASGRTTVKGA